MKETILKILRMTSLTDAQKIEQIVQFLKEDNSKYYWANKLVKLDKEELNKLNKMYGTQIIKNMIVDLDWYIYKTGKKYKSHYLTIINWATRAWIEKVREMFNCSYGNTHYKWDKCTCGNF